MGRSEMYEVYDLILKRRTLFNAFLLLNAILLGLGTGFCQMQSLGRSETFAAAKLSPGEVREVIAVIAKLAYDTPDSWRKELRVRRVDLGATPGLVAQGTNLLCGGTGNCQVFVLHKENKKWISLFDSDAPVGEGFRFGPGAANGIKDFTIATN